VRLSSLNIIGATPHERRHEILRRKASLRNMAGSVANVFTAAPSATVAPVKAVLQAAGEEDHPFRSSIEEVLNSELFQILASLVIVAQTAAMSNDDFDSPAIWKEFAWYCYLGTTGFFAMESVLRLLSLGATLFCTSLDNLWNALLVFTSVAGLMLDVKILIRLSAFRLYRLMRHLPALQNLLHTAVLTTPRLFDVFIFIMLVSVCFAITGRYLIGHTMDELSPRANFSSMPMALLTVFQLFSGDSWTSVMYTAIAAQERTAEAALAGVFVVVFVLFSVCIPPSPLPPVLTGHVSSLLPY